MPADARKPYDVREVIARLADGSRFDEFKPRYGSHAGHGLCAYPRLSGRRYWPTTAFCSRESALKGQRISSSWPSSRIPLLFLQNISGFMVGQQIRERRHRQGWRQDGNRGGHRAGPEVHCADRRLFRRWQLRHVRPRLWTALAVVLAQLAHQRDGRRAGGAGCLPPSGAMRWRPRGKPGAPRRKRPLWRRPVASSKQQSDPYYATARLWDDGIIDPAQTRTALALGLSAALNAPPTKTRFGIFRM